jgi:mono/diheme cytochrome c family protein
MRALLMLVVANSLAAQAPEMSAFQRAKALSLLRTQLPCLGCHQLENEGGRSAPSLTTVGARRNAAYIRAIIEDPQRVVPGSGMPRTVMSPSVRELVTRYLAANAADGAHPPSRSMAANSIDSAPAALYQRWCSSCHGRDGGGDGPDAGYLPIRPAVHRDGTNMGARSDDALFDAIAGGGVVMGKSARMPAFGATLSPAQIRSLVGYIRELCRCVGPPWSRDGKPR